MAALADEACASRIVEAGSFSFVILSAAKDLLSFKGCHPERSQPELVKSHET
jgi:hypothetical protein